MERVSGSVPFCPFILEMTCHFPFTLSFYLYFLLYLLFLVTL